MKGLALGGFMGTGKTTVGQLAADRLGLPFSDVDAILAERFGPIPRQFAEHGEGIFRRREQQVIASLCADPRQVIATGGGAWVHPENRAQLRTCCVLVVLRARIDTLRQRIGDASDRPLWQQASQLLEQRASVYEDADLIVDVDDLSPGEVVAHIFEALGAPWVLAGQQPAAQ